MENYIQADEREMAMITHKFKKFHEGQRELKKEELE